MGTYEFPPTDTLQFTHGMCVLGASYAQATSSNNPDLDYTLVPDFGDGVELWGNRDYTVSGIQGTEMCEGGLYLKPNRHKLIDRFTEIEFAANSIDGVATMCVFLQSSDSRTGKWDEKLPSDRFSVSGEFSWSNGSTSGRMRSYCKILSNESSISQKPSSLPSITPSLAGSIAPSASPTEEISTVFPSVSPSVTATKGLTASPSTLPTVVTVTDIPSERPTEAGGGTPAPLAQLETTYAGGNGQAGNMFDIKALSNIVIREIDIHVGDTNSHAGLVYTKEGSWRGFAKNPGAWIEIGSGFTVEGQGEGKPSSLPPNAFAPISISAGETKGIYITLVSPAIRYTFEGGSSTQIVASDSNLQIFKGVGKRFKFQKNFANRVWNGALRYSIF